MASTPISSKQRHLHLAQAIGEVCMQWAYIESIVADLALELAVYKSPGYDDDAVRHPLLVAVLHMKLRERISLAKALAHEVSQPVDYFDRLSTLLNIIDKELTIERNRFVHDSWEIYDNGIVRFAEGPKAIKRHPSGERRLSMGTEKTFASVDEVRAFVTRLEETTSSLVALESELAAILVARETPPV